MAEDDVGAARNQYEEHQNQFNETLVQFATAFSNFPRDRRINVSVGREEVFAITATVLDIILSQAHLRSAVLNVIPKGEAGPLADIHRSGAALYEATDRIMRLVLAGMTNKTDQGSGS